MKRIGLMLGIIVLLLTGWTGPAQACEHRLQPRNCITCHG